jgi:hypothetical protein
LNATELNRLAALERTLVDAAASEAQRRTRRRRRTLVLAALVAPLVLAAAAAVAATGGLFTGIDQQFSTLRDDRLAARVETMMGFARSVNANPRDRASERSWLVAGHRVVGFTTPSGSFCFRFGKLTRGCLQPGVLTADNPVDTTIDYGPGTFRIYGLAIDDVTAVSLRTGGVTRRAIIEHNAFFLEAKSLGGTRGFSAKLIVGLRDGTTRHLPVHLGPLDPDPPKSFPPLPGVLPAMNAAA